MLKNIVLCADGTCNAYGHSSSNVARLLDFIELQTEDEQVVCYDQGIGTRRKEQARVEAFRDSLGQRSALYLLKPPRDSWNDPLSWPFLVASMTAGLGLKTNVRQLYVKLAELYSPGDRVFLFGFSRGAFTVRALAGLTWRYGLPAVGNASASTRIAIADARFAEAWPLFMREFPDPHKNKARKAREFLEQGGHLCPIHFLGVWDTVKSYGGLRPRMLPNLRHNASVATVRHAMSLNERRGWFEATTWGWLDSDQEKGAAISRLAQSDIEAIKKQDVFEVWFTGCHADVGGGGWTDRSSSIALRWMLGEARQAKLRLNAYGRWFMTMPGECESPAIDESRSRAWRVIDWFPRMAIKNDKTWPRHVWARKASPRRPQDSVRRNTVWYHESVTDLSVFRNVSTGVAVKPYRTSRLRETAVAVGGLPLPWQRN